MKICVTKTFNWNGAYRFILVTHLATLSSTYFCFSLNSVSLKWKWILKSLVTYVTISANRKLTSNRCLVRMCQTKILFIQVHIFGQERLTDHFLSMRFFYDSVIHFTRRCPFSLASTSLSTHSFCESILFVHLKALRGGELRLVRTVGMVRLDVILFETLSKKWH